MQLIPGLTNNKYLHTDSKNFLGQQLVIKQDNFNPKKKHFFGIFYSLILLSLIIKLQSGQISKC